VSPEDTIVALVLQYILLVFLFTGTLFYWYFISFYW
jgi:hypothetical protein